MKSWAWVLGLVCAMWGLPLNGTAQTAPAVTGPARAPPISPLRILRAECS